LVNASKLLREGATIGGAIFEAGILPRACPLFVAGVLIEAGVGPKVAAFVSA
jgi:hypothetical protein